MGYVERALRTLSGGNRTLLRAEDERDLLQDMCRIIVELGGYRMAWVGYVQQDEEKTVRPMAHEGFEAGFLERGHFTWDASGGERGPTAQAILTGKPAIVQDLHSLAGSLLPIPLDEALQRGYASVAAFPLIIEGEVIGNLTIFADERDAFDSKEVELLNELADDLAYGIANLRVRASHRQAEETIRRMAYYDSLTGLPNRTFLHELLSSAMDRAREQHQSLVLMLVKVGHFQEINDSLGYLEGNRLLEEIASRLSRLAQEGEVLARVSEDEFAIVQGRGSAESAIELAQRMVRELYQPIELDGLTVDANACIGIALFPGHGSTPEALMRRAKVAAGQARIVTAKYALYKGAADQECTQRLALMSDLRRAIEHDELLLYCQPQLAMASGRIAGAEALLRWQHPQRGMVATGEFVKLAEHAGLILPLTRWVLEAAFRQSYTWHEMGVECPLSVNLSAQDLRDPQLLDRISGLFATWAVPPAAIHFELTESALMEDPLGAMGTLASLKGLGVKLFVDDFGTGYSSLSYLQKLPVDGLKIDQSFVDSMLSDSDSAIIVRSTIELGHNLGLEVIAEGVASEALWDSLKGLGCDVAQGHYVSAAIPVEQYPEWAAQATLPVRT